MFFDWTKIYQDFDFELPIIGQRAYHEIDVTTGEHIALRQPPHKHEGSYSTSVQISISGNRLTVSGNPSRLNRLENLFGFGTLDECVSAYNRELVKLGLPLFTKCTHVGYLQGKDGTKAQKVTDGAVFQELHITSNQAVGEGVTDDFLKALSTQRYRNSIPRLHTNGKTVDWLSKGNKASLIYPSVYDKAFELSLHQLPKVRQRYGDKSPEYCYLKRVIDFCMKHGVIRYEQKLKSAFLRREGLNFYGLHDEGKFHRLQEDFLAINDKLQVTSMTLEGISERLIRLGICDGTRAANTTAMYAIQWMSGQRFDLAKKQVKVHRARLRKIGLDIAQPCDVSRHSTVYVVKAKEVVVRDLARPDWYRGPERSHLKLVA